MTESNINFDNYELTFQQLTNEYTSKLTDLQNTIKKDLVNDYKCHKCYNMIDSIKFQIVKIISYEYCGKERFIYVYQALIKNIKGETLRAIIYLIGKHYSKKDIKTILELSDKKFNTYLNRIGDKLLENSFINAYYYQNEYKVNIFFKDGKFKDVYKFLNDLFTTTEL